MAPRLNDFPRYALQGTSCEPSSLSGRRPGPPWEESAQRKKTPEVWSERGRQKNKKEEDPGGGLGRFPRLGRPAGCASTALPQSEVRWHKSAFFLSVSSARRVRPQSRISLLLIC